MSWLRIRAIVRRHAYVLKRSPHRWFDVFIWPVVDALLFGSIGVFLAQQSADGQSGAAALGVAYMLAGIFLFHVIYQSEISVSIGFIEETWSRNLLNIMVTPVRELEYIAGVALFGLFKMTIGIGVLALAAWGFFSFAVTDIGWGLIPIGAELLVIGWVISLVVIGLVLRFGQSAEVLAWGILFVIMPLSGIFYPVDSLPDVLQPIAQALPSTHAFAATRELVDGGAMPWDEIGYAAIGCAVAAVAALVFLTRMLSLFRRRGYVTRFS
jgi:ABC-2 type transport system permease protein